jgi:hypothetical protein
LIPFKPSIFFILITRKFYPFYPHVHTLEGSERRGSYGSDSHKGEFNPAPEDVHRPQGTPNIMILDEKWRIRILSQRFRTVAFI